MEHPAQALRRWYAHLKAQRLCVRCQAPVATTHARCAACRARQAQAQARYRIRQIVREGTVARKEAKDVAL